MRVAFLIVAVTAGLAGCVSASRYDPPKPIEQMTTAEWCSYSSRLLGIQGGSPYQKAALYETMRNKGCFGQPQAAQVEIRQR